MNITEADLGKEVISKEAGTGHIVEYNKDLLYPVVVRFDSGKNKMQYHSNGTYNLSPDNSLDIAFTIVQSVQSNNIFNIGDEVESKYFGIGTVINTIQSTKYCIEVKFSTSVYPVVVRFTTTGVFSQDVDSEKNILPYNHLNPMSGRETSSSMNITEKDVGRMVKSVQAGIGYIVSYIAGAEYPVIVNFNKIVNKMMYYTSQGKYTCVRGNSPFDIEFPGLPIIDPVAPNQPEEETNRMDPFLYSYKGDWSNDVLEEKTWREKYETSKICPKIAAVANKIESKIQHVIKGHKITKNSANGEVFLVCKNCNVEVTE